LFIKKFSIREEKKVVNNNERHHICVGTRHNKILNIDEQRRMGGEKGKKSTVEGGYTNLGTMRIQAKIPLNNRQDT
jgi:hypothetical protein